MPVSEGFADTHPNFKFQVERGASMSQLENSSGESSGWMVEGGGRGADATLRPGRWEILTTADTRLEQELEDRQLDELIEVHRVTSRTS